MYGRSLVSIPERKSIHKLDKITPPDPVGTNYHTYFHLYFRSFLGSLSLPHKPLPWIFPRKFPRLFPTEMSVGKFSIFSY